jgi:hypothetical protein
MEETMFHKCEISTSLSINPNFHFKSYMKISLLREDELVKEGLGERKRSLRKNAKARLKIMTSFPKGEG